MTINYCFLIACLSSHTNICALVCCRLRPHYMIRQSYKDAMLTPCLQPGVPLLEIVSEPDMRTGVEAAAYAAELRRIMLFFGITDGNMQVCAYSPHTALLALPTIEYLYRQAHEPIS